MRTEYSHSKKIIHNILRHFESDVLKYTALYFVFCQSSILNYFKYLLKTFFLGCPTFIVPIRETSTVKSKIASR